MRRDKRAVPSRRARTRRADAPAHTILTVTTNAGSAKYTTAAAHGLANGATVSVGGTTVAGYNVGGQTVASHTATTFTTGQAYTADAANGFWV